MPMKATGSAAEPKPMPSRRGSTSGAMVDAPYAAEKNPDSVTPIWTVDRNRLGLPARAAIRAPRFPDFSIRRTWLSRRDTSAISVPANTPPSSTKKRTNRKLSRVSLSMIRHYPMGPPGLRSGALRRRV